MSKFNKITEIIPDDIPEWASDAIDGGDFFSVCIGKIDNLEEQLRQILLTEESYETQDEVLARIYLICRGVESNH